MNLALALDYGFSLFAIRCWLVRLGNWIIDNGLWIMAVRFSLLAVRLGNWIIDNGLWIMAVGC